MSDERRAPPDGFVEATRRGPYTLHNGPIFLRQGQEASEQGFFALERHCNGLGIVHGGMLASFLDGLLGHAVAERAAAPAVTLHLSLDYLSMGRAGDWIQGEARVTRATRDVLFAEARAFSGHRDLIRGSGVFKVMGRRRSG